MNNIIIRRASSKSDCDKLKILLNTIFSPEKVGDLAETFFYHLPGMKNEFWFIAEDKNTSQIVSTFVLIPWQLEIGGILFKVAEIGLVGTSENYRGLGLIKMLNMEFDKAMEDEGFDFAIIQGIPGIYQKFGFYYSVSLENHINLPLHVIDSDSNEEYNFRLAGINDIQFLMKQDELYREHFFISSIRNIDHWKYLLTEGKKTDYGSEFWMMENENRNEKYYFRILLQGFGTGLILSEVTENITTEALTKLFAFVKKLATERNKPYIRLNLHNESSAGKYAIHMGAEIGKPYALQIKIPDKAGIINKMIPIINRRLSESSLYNYNGILRLDFYKERIDIGIYKGEVKSILKNSNENCSNIFYICTEMFPALCLGHRSWQEIQFIHPDVFPFSQYVNPVANKNEDLSGLLLDCLFPKLKSWVYLQY
jgi:hypothetical protein